MDFEEEWKRKIGGIKAVAEETDDKVFLKAQFKEAFIDAVRRGIKKRFGVLFSGGVDSSLIAFVAKKLDANFVCYSVGLEGSKDLESAESSALMLGLKLKTRVFSLEEAKQVLESVVKILNAPDPVQVGIGAVAYAVVNMAKRDGMKTFFSGLGAENLFAGYEYHINAKDVNAACWKSLENMWQQDLKRDFLISKAAKTSFFNPFLDEHVIRAAMSVPSKYKLSSFKKAFLREIACELGLPEEIAFRKKVAAQYGSGFDKALRKISRISGFKYKKDYLKKVLEFR